MVRLHFVWFYILIEHVAGLQKAARCLNFRRKKISNNCICLFGATANVFCTICKLTIPFIAFLPKTSVPYILFL